MMVIISSNADRTVKGWAYDGGLESLEGAIILRQRPSPCLGDRGTAQIDSEFLSIFRSDSRLFGHQLDDLQLAEAVRFLLQQLEGELLMLQYLSDLHFGIRSE